MNPAAPQAGSDGLLESAHVGNVQVECTRCSGGITVHPAKGHSKGTASLEPGDTTDGQPVPRAPRAALTQGHHHRAPQTGTELPRAVPEVTPQWQQTCTQGNKETFQSTKSWLKEKWAQSPSHQGLEVKGSWFVDTYLKCSSLQNQKSLKAPNLIYPNMTGQNLKRTSAPAKLRRTLKLIRVL